MDENKINEIDNEEMEMMHLVLDDDTELDCFVLGIFEVEGKEYIALVPEGEDDLLIYSYKESEEGVELDNIESDEEYELVAKTFDELFADELEDGCGCGCEDDDDDEDEDCGCGGSCGDSCGCQE